MRLFLILALNLLFSFALLGQSSLVLNKDTLACSLQMKLAKIDTAFKAKHFLHDENYDYYNSINSIAIAYELNSVLEKIESPVIESAIGQITFVKCHNWVEAYSTWFITVIDKVDNHYLYFYENNKGITQIELYHVTKEKDYFFSLATNLILSHLSCGEKNEDYIVMGKIIEGRFISFYSSQIFHRMDMSFFNDLLGALRS